MMGKEKELLKDINIHASKIFVMHDLKKCKKEHY